jgi:hypothetical protein
MIGAIYRMHRRLSSLDTGARGLWCEINGTLYSRVFVTEHLGNLAARGTQHLTCVQES